MSTDTKGEITLLLESLRDGNNGALDSLIAVVYDELRRTASALLKNEVPEHTFRTTELVHEAYLRLFDTQHLEWQDRRHFFGSAASAMRRVLVDHARHKRAGKRIPPEQLIALDLVTESVVSEDVDVLGLDRALRLLAELEPRQAQVVELRYFAGLTESEVAGIFEVSRMTVSRDWQMAKLWLRREMKR